MAREGITYEDVVKAAEQILQRNERVTGERIRMTTGTGSHTTIAKHLKRWRKEQSHHKNPQHSQPFKSESAPAKQVELDDDPMTSVVQSMLVNVKQQLHAQSAKFQQEAQQAKEQAIKERDQARELLTQLREEHEQLKQQMIHAQKSQASQPEVIREAQKNINERLEEVNEHQEQTMKAFEEMSKAVKSQREDFMRMIKEQAERQFEELKNVYGQRRQDYIVEKENLVAQMAKQDDAIAQRDKIISDLRSELNAQSNKLAAFETAISKAKSQYEELMKQLNNYQTERTSWQVKYQLQKAEINSLHEMLKDKRQEATES